MIFARYETQALLERATYLRSSLFTWDWEGVSLSKLADLARDIDRDMGRLLAAAAKYAAIDHAESAELQAELVALAELRAELFTPPEA